MATRIKQEIVYGNFKPSKSAQAKARKAKKKDNRSGMCDKHCANIRDLPCIICGLVPSGQIHHLKCTGERGAAMRSTDQWGVPLCHEHHMNGVERVASRLENSWFRERGIDCLSFASALWNSRHSFEAMEKVWWAHWDRKDEILAQFKSGQAISR